MIGIVKILQLERRGDRLRVHFVAGSRAFEYFQTYASIVSRAGRLLTTNPESILQTLERQQNLLHTQSKELEELRIERLGFEARQLAVAAETFDSIRLVTALFHDRSAQQLRALAIHLQHEPGVVALLASYADGRVTLAVTCAVDTGVSANELIRQQLAEIGGRGGGDAGLAQGGGLASEGAFNALFSKTKEYIRTLRK